MLRILCKECTFTRSARCLREVVDTYGGNIVNNETFSMECPMCGEEITKDVPESEVVEVLAKYVD